MSASPSNMPSVDAVQIHPDFGYLAPTMRFRRRFALTLKAGVLGALAGAAAVFFITIDREDKPVTMLATPVLIAPASSTPTAQPQAPVAAAPAAPAQAPVAAVPTAPARGPVATTPTAPARAPAVATPAPPTPTPPTPTRVATDITAPPVRFLPETMALPEAAPRDAARDLGLRGSAPAIAATASGPVPQAPAPAAVGTSPAASAAASAVAPAAVAKAVAKPKKKIVRAPPEPEPEPRTAFARPTRPLGLPIFGFGW